MISFEANVCKASSAYGVYGTITTAELGKYIGKRVSVKIEILGEATRRFKRKDLPPKNYIPPKSKKEIAKERGLIF